MSDFKPQIVGPYLLIEKLAAGGMAEVYRARFTRDAGFEKEVAIKRILPNYATNPEFKSMFEHEARLCSDLNHANIVQVKDFQRIGDTYLLEMEYVDGKNLRQLINKAQKNNITLPIFFGIYVINEVTKGLEYAHTKKDKYTGAPLNIIHRDMSPQNIMVSYDGQVKIVDFGIAKAKNRVDETKSGVIKGKFGYMSPEQAEGKGIDRRSDIFSTSIILYELVTGKRLFSAENDMATLKLIQQCVIPQPSRVNPKISSELEQIILKGLSKESSTRYQSAGELGLALQLYLNKHYPEYSQRNVAETIQLIFKSEIEAEKKRIREISRQSIPYSHAEINPALQPNPELVLDGDLTKSEIVEKDFETSIDISSENKISNQEPNHSDLATIVDTQSPSLNDSNLDSLIEEEKVPITMSRGSVAGELMDKSYENTHSEENTVNDIDIASYISEELNDSNEQISLNENSSHTLNNVSLKEKNNTQEASATEKNYFPDNIYTDYIPPKKRSNIGKLILFAGLIFGVSYVYRFYLEGKLITFLPEIEKILENRNINAEKENHTNTPETATKSYGDCILVIETEPPAATVVVNEREIGTTPLPISSACGKNIQFNVQKKFYKTLEKNLILKSDTKKVYLQLEKIPTGTLRLVLSKNAKVYVDGILEYEAEANKEFDLIITAGKIHNLRFANQVFGIDITRTFSVEPDSIARYNVILDSK